MESKQLKICYFPGREATYMRTRVLLKAIPESGMELLDCSYPKKNVFRYLYGFAKFLKYKRNADIIFVGFLGQHLIPVIRIFTRKKIVFDAFLSVYQTLAYDRNRIRPNGILAGFVKYFEKLSCDLSDLIILDTQEHINYFVDQYGIERGKCRHVLVGCDDELLNASSKPPASNQFIVHFHGEYQRVHGAKYIIEAAKLLPHIKFQMIGSGKGQPECVALMEKYNLENIKFYDSVPYDQLIHFMSQASVCLGLLGDSDKVQLAIPIKVYEALAMGKPVITADTPAIAELLTHKENVYLCKAGDPQSIAAAIQELFDDQLLRDQIGESGRRLFQEKCTPKMIGEDLKSILEEMTS